MKNITAVEWLVNQLPLGVKDTILDKIEQAKAMEWQQIIDAGNDNIFCDAYTIDEEDNYKLTTKGELYYNDTFNN
jgi:hypothetical protein